ncbi:hemagglutinin repeat-containing protein [Glaciimonas sp. PAMC28666]|uniref:hemagglutinin repeat-containing protein n=1 Tax=Glaciimonas sp. PAMC28666 TaxID=2807626 RepID=UPI0019628758|nr:hemagglutinin repeat-containing protein [Glaciimonas sp. PAMC28666]QRX80833.1 hemagglutinin repeat-containing protein [Glaciimonas sp. PAMC28666]
MNTQAYRVIFNRHRGIQMAVAENVSGQGKGGSAGSRARSISSPAAGVLRMVTLGVVIAALFGSVTVVHAQIVADPNAAARRPTVTQTASGLPLVQITTPNAAGLSHNQYNQFSVGAAGAILNNATVVTTTQQAGFIAGNPNLTNGSARVILNEVTGTARSQLNGYIEVAGQRADVIVANPNGLSVSGGGFINTSRGVLTTGTPVIGSDGSLSGLRVTGGDIAIGSGGLNGNNMDQLDLIARSVAINGQLWATTLNVVTGTNQVNYSDLTTQAITGDNNVPTVSIDLAALGSIYANKIRLVGTEAGVGVVSMGNLAAQAGAISIDNNGLVTLAGSTSATGPITVNGTSGVTNSGTVYSQQSATLTSAGTITNSGTLAAQTDLTLTGGNIASTGILGAGIDAQNHASQAGNLQLTATGTLSATGQNSAGSNITMTGTSLDLAHATTNAAGNVALTATAGNIDHTGGTLQATGAVTLAATGALINDLGTINTAQLSSTAGSVSNVGGTFTQTGTGATTFSTTGAFNNSNGVLQTNATDLTLAPQALNNSGGTIALAGNGTLTVDVGNGSLNNAGGSIGSNGATVIAAGSLANAHGSVFGQATSVTTSGDIDNSHGGYLGGTQLTLTAAHINNSTGSLEGTQNGLTVNATSLTNNGGTVQSTGSAPLTITTTQGITNGMVNGIGGFIGSAGAVGITSGAFDNTGGTLYAASTLALQANGQLTNSGGVIQSGTNLSASATGALDNTHGRIEANGSTATLTVSGSSVDNTDGRIANSGTGLTQINGGSAITNTNAGSIAGRGTIGGNGDVDVTATNLNNSAGGQLLALGNLTLNVSNAVNNNAGALYAGQNLQLNQPGATLTNVAGSISAAGTLTLNAASLDNSSGVIATTAPTGDIALFTAGNVTNSSGTIGSDRNLSLTASTLVGNGQLLAAQDTALSLQGDYTNTAGNTISANRDLSFTTTGTLTNSGTLAAVRNVTLAADNVNNQSSGLINAGNGTTVVLAANNLTNTGRIYGNEIALGAHTLTNTVDATTGLAGVIASRDTLQIGAQQITNSEHALMQSLGDMTFGGALDANNNVIGNAASIVNGSATIDAGGALVFQSASLINQNNHFTTAQQVDPTQTTQVTEYASWVAPTTWYTPSQVTWGDSGNGGIVLIMPNGDRFEKFYKKDYTQVVSTTVVTGSDPGTIRAGGNMVLSGTVTNDKSTIVAGGTLSGSTGAINNIGATGETDTTDQMTASQNYYHYVSGHPHQNYYDYDNGSPAEYDVALPSTPLALAVWSVQQNTQPAALNNAALGSGVGSTTTPGGNTLALTTNGSTQGVGSGHRTTVGTPTSPLPNLVLPNNQLFTIHPQPGQPYLVATDPAFTSYGNFISSDYMLGLLGINPAATQKRLGDGFYEEQVVSNQITQLTGNRFLSGYSDNQDEYKALMDAGVASAKAFQLTPGIALTAAQMAALTADMVWMVSTTVTLADGSTTQVLAPVVYLTRADAADLAPTGALLSASDINLSVNGTLQNGGTLQARNNLLISATDIANSGSVNTTGTSGTTMLVARNDVLNNGGTITGHRVGILAGRDVTLDTGTASATSSHGTNTVLGPVANISADTLSVQAGRDVTLAAAAITTTGDTTLAAGRNVNLNAVNTHTTSNVTYNADNHLNATQTQANGTTVNAGGNLTLQAGQDITASAATATAGGQLTAVAGRDITLGSAQQDSTLDQAIYTTSHGLFSSSTSRSQTTSSATVAIGSTLTGNAVTLQSVRDTSVQGSQVSATGDLTINAGRDLAITSAQNTGTETVSSAETKSGFSGNLLSGITLGHNAQDQTQTVSSVSQNASSLSGGTISTSSGRDTTITASNLIADQDVSISAGRNIAVLAAASTQTTDSHAQSSGSSIGVMGGFSGHATIIGQTSALQTGNGTDTVQNTSLLSANGGNLSLQAGLDNQYQGTGQGNITTQRADLLAQNRLSIGGNAVDLQAIQDSSTSQSHAETQSATIGSSMTGAIGGTITAIGDMATEAQATDSGRLKGALALKAGYDAYKLASGLSPTVTAAAATDPNPASSGGGFGVSVDLGTSHSQQDSSNTATQARGTSAQASAIDVTSRTGDITMEGAKLQAQDISLTSAQNIDLSAAVNTATLQSSNSGSSAGIGATLGSNGQQTGLSFHLGASSSTGSANGTETTYDNTQITATDQLNVTSGADLTLQGAQLAGNKVNAAVGGNLTIVTQQDVSDFASKQESGGFGLSLCIPPICVGQIVTASVNYAKQTIDHDYLSAQGQSGIAAGSDGFAINVHGNTALTGAAITSTAPAANNTLSTASLTSTDLINAQHTEAESISVSASTASLALNAVANVIGNLNGSASLPANNSQTSSTNSVISPATVTITGTGNAAQDALSQATAATLTSRDASTANGALSNTLTLQQAQQLPAQQQEQQENQRAADLVGSVLNNVVGDLAQGVYPDGSPEKILLHGIVGLIEAKIGGGNGAAGAIAGMSVEAMSPILSTYLLSNGYSDDPTNKDAFKAYNDMMSLGATLVGAASGTLAGSNVQNVAAGASIGLTADINNRQLHPKELTTAQQVAAASNGQFTAAQAADAMRAASYNTQSVSENVSSNAIVGGMVNGQPNPTLAFDNGASWSVNSVNGQAINLVQNIPTAVDPALAALIIAQTGGSKSPYSWTPSTLGIVTPSAPVASVNPFAAGWNTGNNSAGLAPDTTPQEHHDNMVSFTDNGATLTGMASIWAPPPFNVGLAAISGAFKASNYLLSPPNSSSVLFDTVTTVGGAFAPDGKLIQTGIGITTTILQPVVIPILDNKLEPLSKEDKKW